MKVISFEIAQQLWDKEYRDISSLGNVSSLYDTKTQKHCAYINFGIYTHFSSGYISAPTYFDVIDWFRDKHALIITILPKSMSRNFRGYEIESIMIGKIKVLNQDEDIPYYEALDKAIEEALKLI